MPLCAASSPLTPSPTIIVFLTHGTNQSKENKLPFTRCCLLLLSLLLLSLLPSPLLTLALVALVGALVAQLAESTTLDRLGQLRLLDLGNGRGDGGNGESGTGREDGVLNGLEVLLGGVGLLGLVGLLGEEDEAGGVSLQALHVGSKRLLGKVLAAGVDRDADGRSVLAGDTGGLRKTLLVSVRGPTICPFRFAMMSRVCARDFVVFLGNFLQRGSQGLNVPSAQPG